MKLISVQGFFMKPNPDARTDSVIGGSCLLPDAVSPNTGRPLLQLASLDARDAKLVGLTLPFPSLPLFYSWTCAIHQAPLVYRIREDRIEVLEYKHGPGEQDFPYENYPNAFEPVSISLVSLSEPEQDVIVSLNRMEDADERLDLMMLHPDLSTPQHQLGGEPYFVGGTPAAGKCPCCQREMSLLGSICDDNYLSDLGFVGNEFVQLVYQICDQCVVIQAENFCD